MDASQFRTIDWVADAEEQNRIRLSRSKNRLSWKYLTSASISWLIHAASGAVIGVIAVLLTLATSWLADLREGHCRSAWYLNESLCCLYQSEESCGDWVSHPRFVAYFIYICISVVFAVTASLLVTTLAPMAAGSGISEIKCIISGFYASRFLDAVTLIVKCIALPLTIASGLSVGKEGPSVHYSACVGHVVTSKFGRQDYKKRTDILTACCAAGVAVAFGSPIGGVLFGLEEMANEMNLNTVWRSYFCCLVATSVVAMFNPLRTGQLVLFSVRYDTSWQIFDLPFFLVLGLFGGVAGHFIVKYNLRITALRKKFWGAKHYLIEAAVLSFITAVTCYFNGYLKVDMTRSMQVLFHECDHGGELHVSCDPTRMLSVMSSLATAGIIRTLLLVVTYGAAKVPAGIFVPSLAIGALFGRFVGTFVWLLQSHFPNSAYFRACSAVADGSNCVNPGAYALLGAGALLSGVMNMSLTVVVVMFELTGALHYVVPTMIVVGVTRLASSQLGGEGIADMAIRQNNYPYLDREHIDGEHEHDEFGEKTAIDIMIPAVDCVVVRAGSAPPRPSPSDSAGSTKQYRTYPVLDGEKRLVAATTGTKTDNSPLIVRPEDSLESVYTLFARLGPQSVFVVDNKGIFVGLITRKMVSVIHKSPQTEFSTLEVKIGKSISQACDVVNKKIDEFWQLIRRPLIRGGQY